MARRPTIGITTYGPEGELETCSLPRAYAEGVAAAGGVGVLLAATGAEPDDVLDSLDGLIVAGGGDLAPESYGGGGHETIYSVNPARDAFEVALVKRALARSELPLVGICRGMQVMNVVLGGDLEPHLPDAYGEKILHRLPPRLPTTHDVRVERSGLFGELFAEPEFPVCSWHHQALRKLGAGVRVAGHAPDGVVEAMVVEGHPFALGVQWHPEMQFATDPRQLAVFRAIVERARRRRAA
jgi:putative glutamine amidotransferase